MALSPRRLNRATLARQLLLRRAPVDVVGAVRRVVALQAQEPASPYLALWNRVDGFDPADLDAAFADGELVKAPLMRITLHAVDARDYTAFHEAMVASLRASRLHDRRYTSTGLTTADADAVLPHVVAFASRPRTKAEIEELLGEHVGAPPEPRLWWALRTFAPLAHAPTGGPWSFGPRPSFVAAPTVPARLDPGQALRRLVRRYLEGFGPASAEDIARFTLQRRTVVRETLRAMADELTTVEGPGGVELADVPGGELPDEDTPAPARLLGMWDSILLAYADRSRIIPDEHRREVIRRNGDVLPTLLVDGEVRGVWRPLEDGIEALAFERLTDETWDALAGEARGLLTLLAARDPAVYGRYGHWWSKLPGAEVRVLRG
ncbi:MAG: winged helix DNA-binding domain-containing protein [Actinobacteria bacterium]|nr:winged helix DNA-binding domain-containing protein [Actinomycetota bacterium]